MNQTNQTNQEQQTQKTTIGFTDQQLIDALKDIFQHYGYDLWNLGTDAKKDIANRLSQVAQHSPPWEWRYVHNFMTGGVQAGVKFKSAIVGLAGMIDGMPLHVVQGHQVQVTALGIVKPGALIYGDSQKCGNISCPIHFVPRVWNQKYCSVECQRQARRAARK